MSGLEPDRATLQAWLDVFAGFAFDSVDALEHTPAMGTVGRGGLEIADAVSVPIGEAALPGGVAAIVDILARASAASLTAPGPGYLAYIPGGGLPSAALADFVGCLLNRYTGLSAAAPALCRLEADALAWCAGQFGLPTTARGLFTSGGSIASFSAVVTARAAKLGDDGDLRDAIVYTSHQAHHSVAKAVMLAGIPPRNVRAIDTDERFRLDVAALSSAIATDRAAGLRPFLLVSAAGTTNTGAVDPLDRLADVCATDGLWHHVDGAYGGAFVLTEEGRAILRGIERADSITFDPHKGMFLPYGTGCLLVRDGELLRRAHHVGAGYLQDFEALDRVGEPPSPTEYGPELSRSFRGLRVWLPLVLHGAGAFRSALAEKLALARRFHDALRAAVDAGAPIEIVDPPQLSTVAFRAKRRDGEAFADWNARNAAWQRDVNARARVHLSSTTLPSALGPVFTLRVCVLSFRTHARHIDAGVEDLLATVSGAAL